MIDRLEEVLERLSEEREEQAGMDPAVWMPPASAPAPPVMGWPAQEEPGQNKSDGTATADETPEETVGLFQPPQWTEKISGPGFGDLWPEEKAALFRAGGSGEKTWPAADAAGQVGPGAQWPEGRGTENSLSDLYRQVSRAVRGAGTDFTSVPQPVTVTEQRVNPTAGLTIGELDRAVRRDSRRYDGGMSIY